MDKSYNQACCLKIKCFQFTVKSSDQNSSLKGQRIQGKTKSSVFMDKLMTLLQEGLEQILGNVLTPIRRSTRNNETQAL